MVNFTNKKSLVDALRNQIATRDNQAIKALITVYNNQTSSEQYEENTHIHNGVGFTPADAEFMSSLAKQYLKKGWLSPKQMTFVKKYMPKYANQLINQSLETGKIVKDGSNYTWQKESKPVVPSLGWEDDWIKYKDEYSKIEAEQERKAFLSDPDYLRYIGA